MARQRTSKSAGGSSNRSSPWRAVKRPRANWMALGTRNSLRGFWGRHSRRREIQCGQCAVPFSRSLLMIAETVLNAHYLVASLMWGSVGLGLFIYGKKQQSMVPLFGGLLIIGISYFIDSALYM